jgi:hypothetical protein
MPTLDRELASTESVLSGARSRLLPPASAVDAVLLRPACLKRDPLQALARELRRRHPSQLKRALLDLEPPRELAQHAIGDALYLEQAASDLAPPDPGCSYKPWASSVVQRPSARVMFATTTYVCSCRSPARESRCR